MSEGEMLIIITIVTTIIGAFIGKCLAKLENRKVESNGINYSYTIDRGCICNKCKNTCKNYEEV